MHTSPWLKFIKLKIEEPRWQTEMQQVVWRGWIFDWWSEIFKIIVKSKNINLNPRRIVSRRIELISTCPSKKWLQFIAHKQTDTMNSYLKYSTFYWLQSLINYILVEYCQNLLISKSIPLRWSPFKSSIKKWNKNHLPWKWNCRVCIHILLWNRLFANWALEDNDTDATAKRRKAAWTM